MISFICNHTTEYLHCRGVSGNDVMLCVPSGECDDEGMKGVENRDYLSLNAFEDT